MATVNKIYGMIAIVVVLFCIFASTCDAFGVEVFGNKHFKGQSTTIDIKGCTDIPREWDDTISSIQPQDCVIIYKHPRCQGPRVRLEPWSFGTARLEEINFEYKLSSISPCKFQSNSVRDRDEY